MSLEFGDSAEPTRAAGVMFITPKAEVLFLKRGPGGDFPGSWCFPGGHAEGAETAAQTAERETIEELGFLPEGERTVWTRRIANNEIAATLAPDAGLPPTDAVVVPGAQTDFVTFLQRVPDRFDPEVSGEHTGFAWANANTPPEPLHPGCRVALQRLTMDELDIAQAMAAGELASPQRYHNVWLFAIRITGTGHAYRNGRQEHVWRDKSLYLTDRMLARCNGLAVIWEHPEDSMLNTKEYANRVIGSIFLPYIQGEDVWGIAKIQDSDAAADMAEQDLSTSPGVVLTGVDDDTVKLEDGSVLLIEGKPLIVDHIAIVPRGVWDKGGEPTGVRNDSTKEVIMAEETEAEKKAREDKARHDAEGGNIEKLLSHLDAQSKVMDSVVKRLDAMEMADKARRDAEEDRKREDAQSRRDAEREEWMKADAEQCKADDAEEEKERGEIEGKGEPKELAADKARKGRKDRMDKRRKDAEQAEKDRKDAEDKVRKDAEDKVRKDAAGDIEKLVADAVASRLPRDRGDTERAELADAQVRADAAYTAFGERAPAPLVAELPTDYRRRLASPLKKHSKEWASEDLRSLNESVLAIAEKQIYADAVAAARSDEHIPEGKLIPFRRTNESGHQITEFRGRTSIFKSMSAPTQRVTAFLTEKRA
jgi:8-oxo-dGTP pyrophosphatase MutT (NUDIX family)